MHKLILYRLLDMERPTCVLDLIPAESFYRFIKDRICVTVVYAEESLGLKFYQTHFKTYHFHCDVSCLIGVALLTT
jgi:hypothetical protein